MTKIVKYSIIIIAIAAISFIISLIANGIEYRILEDRGIERNASAWIIWWTDISFFVGVAGLVSLSLGWIQHTKANHST
ncbi:hypothetical protein [Corynebacterium sp. sy039]|uniref:hypothetical protein n=1 Tax=Corynebacterium sp. sy039 TaxID=2599641 RepID=UPI0011B6DC72|nr:hypothetical protein [Corynebacterium sp. sy039]QDZ41817.1 hypothetical protein FQV43_00525 [Corynebacterium sp. sy039]